MLVKKIVPLLFILFFQLPIYATASDVIYVTLDSETPLLPLFLSQVEASNTKLSKEFLNTLRDVLFFDLNYNGATRVLSPKETARMSSLENQNSFDATCDFGKIKHDNVLYLIKLKVTGNELAARVISVNGEQSRLIDQITLTGDLAKDRIKIHQLQDTIHKLLFERAGIASSKILFTKKQQISNPDKKSGLRYISEVYEADYDGKNVRQITHEGTLCTNPVYIPAKPGLKVIHFAMSLIKSDSQKSISPH